MADIRFEVVQNLPQLHPCLFAVNRLDRVGQFTQFRSAVEIHVARVSIDPVANTAALMLHTEVLNLVAVLFQCFPQLKNVGFRSAVRMQKFITKQNSHIFNSLSLFFLRVPRSVSHPAFV